MAREIEQRQVGRMAEHALEGVDDSALTCIAIGQKGDSVGVLRHLKGGGDFLRVRDAESQWRARIGINADYHSLVGWHSWDGFRIGGRWASRRCGQSPG